MAGRRFAALGVLVAVACAAPPRQVVTVASPPVAAAPPAKAPEAGAASAAPVTAAEGPAPDEETDEVPLDTPVEAAPAAPAARTRGWLGVELEPAGPTDPGVRVGRVVPRSPAEKGGLLSGDLILRIDERPVSAPQDVVAIVSSQAAGARVGVALRRGKADRLAAVTLGAYPERDELFRMSFVDLPAPPFELLQAAKGSFAPSLTAQRGKVVLVEFWAPWCVACRTLIPHMNQLHAQYAVRGLSVVGITTDPVARAAAAASQLGMEYPIASDESGKTMRAYNASAIPAVFVIDRRGTVRDVMIGYDPARIAQVDALVQRLLAER